MGLSFLEAICSSDQWVGIPIDTLAAHSICLLCGDMNDWIVCLWQQLIYSCPYFESLVNPLQLGLFKIVCTELGVAHFMYGMCNIFSKFVSRLLQHLRYLATPCSNNCFIIFMSTMCNYTPQTISELAIEAV